MSQAIGPKTRVTLHFALRLADGRLIDGTFERKDPVTFSIGDGSLLEGFEQVMFGLQAGTRQTFQLTPEQGFGVHNPGNVQVLPKDKFPGETELVAGLMLSFENDGKEMPGVVTEVVGDQVTIDFNHPLAGQDLEFEVEILNVEAAEA